MNKKGFRRLYSLYDPLEVVVRSMVAVSSVGTGSYAADMEGRLDAVTSIAMTHSAHDTSEMTQFVTRETKSRYQPRKRNRWTLKLRASLTLPTHMT